jgi:hypothetical protein
MTPSGPIGSVEVLGAAPLVEPTNALPALAGGWVSGGAAPVLEGRPKTGGNSEAPDAFFMDWLEPLLKQAKAEAGLSSGLSASVPIKDAAKAVSDLSLESVEEPSEESTVKAASDTRPAEAPTKAEAPPVALEAKALSSQDLAWIQQLGQLNANVQPGLVATVPLQQALQLPANANSPAGQPFQLSQAMQSFLKQAAKQGGNLRVQVSDQASVLLRIRGGRVSAEFRTSQPEALVQLQQEVLNLRQRLASSSAVEDVSVRYEEEPTEKRQQQPKRQARQNAEPEHSA